MTSSHGHGSTIGRPQGLHRKTSQTFSVVWLSANLTSFSLEDLQVQIITQELLWTWDWICGTSLQCDTCLVDASVTWSVKNYGTQSRDVTACTVAKQLYLPKYLQCGDSQSTTGQKTQMNKNSRRRRRKIYWNKQMYWWSLVCHPITARSCHRIAIVLSFLWANITSFSMLWLHQHVCHTVVYPC